MAAEEFWSGLAEESPEQVCHRTGARYDEASGGFVLPVLDGTLLVDPCTRQFVWLEAGAAPDQTVEVAAAAYLQSAQGPPRSEEWVSPLDLPSGAFFFRGPHALPTAGLEVVFGASPDRFRTAAEALGGTPLAFADAAYRLVVFPYLPLAVLLWRGDEEFPARVRFLVARAAGAQLPLDALLGVTGMVANRLLQLGDQLG